MNKVIVVVTTYTCGGERELIADVVLVTRDEKKAKKVEKALKDYIISGKTKGLVTLNINPQNLNKPISGWGHFTREIEGVF